MDLQRIASIDLGDFTYGDRSASALVGTVAVFCQRTKNNVKAAVFHGTSASRPRSSIGRIDQSARSPSFLGSLRFLGPR
jgi:hypothetical protein